MIYLLNEVDISDRKFHEKNKHATFLSLLKMKKILCFFCTKFNDIRSDLVEKLGLLRYYQELKPKSHESISLLNKILNQQNIDNVKLISNFISSALLLREFIKSIVKILYLLV